MKLVVCWLQGTVLLDMAMQPRAVCGRFEAMLVLLSGHWPPRGLVSGCWPPGAPGPELARWGFCYRKCLKRCCYEGHLSHAPLQTGL